MAKNYDVLLKLAASEGWDSATLKVLCAFEGLTLDELRKRTEKAVGLKPRQRAMDIIKTRRTDVYAYVQEHATITIMGDEYQGMDAIRWAVAASTAIGSVWTQLRETLDAARGEFDIPQTESLRIKLDDDVDVGYRLGLAGPERGQRNTGYASRNGDKVTWEDLCVEAGLDSGAESASLVLFRNTNAAERAKIDWSGIEIVVTRGSPPYIAEAEGLGATISYQLVA